MEFNQDIKIRNYDQETDVGQVENLERRCEVGPSDHVFLFTDTMGDPICRIRNSPMHKMLVAESDNNELVGLIQGSIKVVTVRKELARVGYVLGLRVSPLHRRKGIGSSLVYYLEQWFMSNQVDFVYMATEKDNQASVKLFMDKFGFIKFRTPAILVNPVNKHHSFRISSKVEVKQLEIEEAECMYRKFMGSTEFFPHDIDRILKNKLSLGTWVAYPKSDDDHYWFGEESRKLPSSWAMVSVWNSGEIFKLRLGKAPLSCLIYSKGSRLIEKALPCFKVPAIPDFFQPFGFYFMYGLHWEGPFSGKMVRALCHFVHNMAVKSEDEDCKAIVTEVGGGDMMRLHIPHWKLLSCPEDLWCIKALKGEERLKELTKTPTTRTLFVDPREV